MKAGITFLNRNRCKYLWCVDHLEENKKEDNIVLCEKVDNWQKMLKLRHVSRCDVCFLWPKEKKRNNISFGSFKVIYFVFLFGSTKLLLGTPLLKKSRKSNVKIQKLGLCVKQSVAARKEKEWDVARDWWWRVVSGVKCLY